jgi:hypothetical protein
MKILIFSSTALVGLLLVGLQHQQIRELRAKNGTLQQSSVEASRLKADLAKSTGDESQDEAKIAQLREENHDLLKLRNEVNQLREAKVKFEKASAENQRLQLIAQNTARTEAKQSMQPIVIRVNDLFNRGQNTPEDAMQTFFWAAREHNTEALTRCVVPESRSQVGSYAEGDGFKDVISMEIAAHRELDGDTVQLGILIHMRDDSRSPIKFVMKLSRKNGEWRLDLKNPL